jgi:Icc-related predicted phosphoesterase
MKILAFTDVHENLSAFKEIEKKADKADLLICAGDLTIFETHIGPMMKRLGKIKKPTLMIPGNHETPEVLKKYCSFYDNIIFIHKRLKKFKDYYFLGWGGGGFSQVEKEFETLIRNVDIKNKKIVLVTHAPPGNTKLDIIGKVHHGTKSITKYIRQNKNIILHICGHFHETWGARDKVNNTLLINPGPKGEILTL